VACDKPNGSCTDVSPCASNTGGGCDEPSTPILPRCQDVSLAPGAYTNATVVVNAAGCISLVQSGEPELYAPDDCCAGGSGGGPTATGGRGPKGDPGQAATVAVEPNIPTSPDSFWRVENVGTAYAAVFKFSAPAKDSSGGGTPSGATGKVAGLEVESGLVRALPTRLVNFIQPSALGERAGLFQLTCAPTNPQYPNDYTVSLNLDTLVGYLEKYAFDLDAAQQLRMDAVSAELASVSNRLTATESKLATTETRVTSLEARVAALENKPA
jgi:hypothetical protein